MPALSVVVNNSFKKKRWVNNRSKYCAFYTGFMKSTLLEFPKCWIHIILSTDSNNGIFWMLDTCSFITENNR